MRTDRDRRTAQQGAARYPRVAVRTLDPQRYAETFAVFIARSSEYAAMRRRLAEAAADCPAGFACLDVGAGTGKVVREWLAAGGRAPGRYTAIEPNPAHAGALRAAIVALGLEGEVLAAPFDPQFRIPDGHHLALFSHSLYWMPDPVGCVRHALGSLNAGGFVLAFLQSPAGVHPFFRLFEPLFARDRPVGADHGLSSHELVLGLRAAGLAPRLTYDPSSLDLTGLFDASARRELDDFISFCLQLEFAEVPEPTRADAIAYLRLSCVEAGGRLTWHHPTATVRIDT